MKPAPAVKYRALQEDNRFVRETKELWDHNLSRYLDLYSRLQTVSIDFIDMKDEQTKLSKFTAWCGGSRTFDSLQEMLYFLRESTFDVSNLLGLRLFCCLPQLQCARRCVAGRRQRAPGARVAARRARRGLNREARVTTGRRNEHVIGERGMSVAAWRAAVRRGLREWQPHGRLPQGRPLPSWLRAGCGLPWGSRPHGRKKQSYHGAPR